ncbi:hypothetical protein [Sulfoacidibacillus thermotolerans]|uniref:hypothetical protein n=1 Tax=Sulfoacidibacillus thermotolerans TaxID=1765684 RepID=UPI0015E8185B|nr:hypothetical protein [Sulfoacidibacillus thermotolerans]
MARYAGGLGGTHATPIEQARLSMGWPTPATRSALFHQKLVAKGDHPTSLQARA